MHHELGIVVGVRGDRAVLRSKADSRRQIGWRPHIAEFAQFAGTVPPCRCQSPPA